jgi:hypothetical protein
MKKYIVSIAGLLVAAGVSFGASVTVPVTVGTAKAVFTNGPAKVTAISITTTNTSSVTLYDAQNSTLTLVTPAYTNITQYATNYVFTWTNYFGVTNSYTNLSLVTTSNSVAAATNAAPARASLSSASGTTTVAPVNYLFNYGIWATNNTVSGANNTVQLTVQYIQ